MTVPEILKANWINAEASRRDLNSLWLSLHRQGVKLPTSDEVAALIKGMMPTNGQASELNSGELSFYYTILVGLSGLCQLALINERM